MRANKLQQKGVKVMGNDSLGWEHFAIHMNNPRMTISVDQSSSFVAQNNGNLSASAAGEEEAKNQSRTVVPNKPDGSINNSEQSKNVDIETFLHHSANLSAKHTAEFMQLLEAEVDRRLEGRIRKNDNNTERNEEKREKKKPWAIIPEFRRSDEMRRQNSEKQQKAADEEEGGAGATLEGTMGTDEELPLPSMGAAAEGIKEGQGSSSRLLELKTVNTRLFSAPLVPSSGEEQKAERRLTIRGIGFRVEREWKIGQFQQN